jgi:UDP-N-acetylglucosamine 4,6-dehydratase
MWRALRNWSGGFTNGALDPDHGPTRGPHVHETIRTALITGGTGTFGHAMAKRFLSAGVEEIRIFSRDEKKQHDMREAFNSPRLKFYIGDVRDLLSVRDAMVGVDVVFHAAALKQVPSCEFYPVEAIRTNALGADNVLRAAVDAGVASVVVLSTDKAAYPINAMGISKAMMEKIMVARSRVADGGRTVLCATRYGNVMGSRGSVIPLFVRQVLRGQPLTVTDPAMTRFMMVIDEAIDLVLYAFEHARTGDIFVRKAPAATIETLIAALQRIFQTDVPARAIGTRHGEKLYETLLTKEEMVRAEDMGDYFRVTADTRDLNYDLYYSEGMRELTAVDDYHSHNTRRLTTDELVALLLRLECVQEGLAGRVPE